MLDAAEEKWAPADDPVFQLVPLSFEPYVTQCFEDLGKPEVNTEKFWDVYHRLRDLVEIAVPDDVTATLGESIRDDGDVGKQDVGVDEDEDEDGGGVLHVDFTIEEDRDELF